LNKPTNRLQAICESASHLALYHEMRFNFDSSSEASNKTLARPRPFSRLHRQEHPPALKEAAAKHRHRHPHQPDPRNNHRQHLVDPLPLLWSTGHQHHLQHTEVEASVQEEEEGEEGLLLTPT
jgi:hypothetical protein